MKESNVNYKIILVFIIVLAITIRGIYICKTNIAEYQFDVGIGDLNSEEDYDNLYENFDKDQNEGRHINYIMQLYTYNSLPNKIIGQFYHPPLHHFIMSMWLKLVDNISDSSSFKFESMQFVTLMYSIVILIALYKILEELEIKDKNKIVPIILFSFYPLYIYLSGSINNDELVTMFALISLLYLIKWQKNPDMKNAIIIALTIGLGLMTKTSMAVMIIPAVYVYFKTLIEFVDKEKDIKNLLIQLVIFSLISSSLGLSFHIRSILNGLNTLGIIEPYEYLNIGQSGFLNRFVLMNIFETSNVNIWNYLIYSSLNFIVNNNTVYNVVMAIVTIILVIYTIYFIIKNRRENKLLIITFIAWWLSYIYLNVSMPYTCSMHSRYMLVPISIGIIFLGLGIQNENSEILKKQVYIFSIIISIMSIFSILLK